MQRTWVVLLAAALVVPCRAVVIDDFIDPYSPDPLVIPASGPAVQSVVSSQTGLGGVLGGNRRTTLARTIVHGAFSGSRVEATNDPVGGLLVFESGPNATGNIVREYGDTLDNGVTNINLKPRGEYFFRWHVAYTDQPNIKLRIEARSGVGANGGVDRTQWILNLPTVGSETDFDVLFSSGTVLSGAGANMGAVRKLFVELNTLSSVRAADYTVLKFETVPEPATLAFLLGVPAAAAIRRRRRR